MAMARLIIAGDELQPARHRLPSCHDGSARAKCHGAITITNLNEWRQWADGAYTIAEDTLLSIGRPWVLLNTPMLMAMR